MTDADLLTVIDQAGGIKATADKNTFEFRRVLA